MLIPKKDILKVYNYLMQEGVIVIEDDVQPKKHFELDVENVHVLHILRSFKSRGFVRCTFAWEHFYYFLNNEGIEFLRSKLNLAPEVVPATLKKVVRPQRAGFGGERPRGPAAPRAAGARGGREEYREGGEKKASSAPADFKPEFRGPRTARPAAPSGTGFARGAGRGAPTPRQ